MAATLRTALEELGVGVAVATVIEAEFCDVDQTCHGSEFMVAGNWEKKMFSLPPLN